MCDLFQCKVHCSCRVNYSAESDHAVILRVYFVVFLCYWLQDVVHPVAPEIITPGNALRLSARQDLHDKDGNPRSTGEEWLVREVGAYLRDVYEEVGGTHMTHAYVQSNNSVTG